MDDAKKIDAVMIGRAGVDLYGEQVGGRLADMGSFAKYIGGSPTNTSIGASRLGLRTALITRVGNDAMGYWQCTARGATEAKTTAEAAPA